MKQKKDLLCHWKIYQTHVRAIVLPSPVHDLKTISYWRNEIFLSILIYVTPLSIIALIPGVYMSFANGMPIIGFIDIFSFLSMILIMLNHSLSLRVRKLIFISVFYVLSLTLIYYLAEAGPGLLFLLVITVLSSIIYSSSAGYYSAWLNTLICIAFFGINYFDSTISGAIGYSPGRWIAVTSNLILLSFVCAKCLDLLMKGLANSLSINKISVEKLGKAVRLYQFISQINQSLVYMKDEESLFRNSCEIAYKIGKFKMAWIGKFDTTGKKITVIYQKGITEENLSRFTGFYESNGPQDHIMRNNSYYVCNDIENESGSESWRSFASFHGIRSCIILPIKKGGVSIGSFNLYATEPGFFDEMEIALLEEATGDISFALDIFEKEKRHKSAEELIIKNENRFRSLIEKSTDMKMLTNSAGDFIYGSPSVTKLFGYSMEEVLNKPAIGFFHPDDIPDFMEKRAVILGTPGASFSFQYRLLHKNKSWIWCEGTLTNMLHEDGINAMVSNFTDISKRKAAENELVGISDDLQKALEDLQKIMDSSLDMICTMNDEGKFVKVSAASVSMLGYQPDELAGKKHIDMVWHKDVEKTSKIAVEIMNGIPVNFFENRCLHKNGSVITILWSATWDSKDKLMYCIAKDVTERKKIERKLNKSEIYKNDVLKELVSANLELVHQNKEKEMRAAELIIANKELVYQNGEKEMRAAELVIANRELTYQDDEKEKRAAELIIANKELIYQNGEKEKRAEELIIANEELIYQNEQKEKRAAELISAYKDLQVAKQRKEFAKNNLTALINSTDDLMWSVNKEYKLIISNKRFNDILRITSGKAKSTEGADEVLIMRLLSEKLNHYKEYYKRALEGESFMEIEHLEHPLDLWSEISFHPIRKGDEIIGAACHSHNITEKKRAEQERIKMSVDIIERSKNLEQFASIVSHNLRAPVASILGLANVLKDNSSVKDKARSQQFLFGAAEELDNVLKDLNKILQVRSEITEYKEVVYFQDLVDAIKSSIPNLIDNEAVQIVTDFSELDNITSIKSYIYSIFYNLISNSIKYRETDRTPVINIISRINDQKIRICFKDNGIGIDLALYGDSIFGIYKRFHLNIEGKGLGLFMVKAQVEALGGSINVTSEENKGAEFVIELPL